KKHVPGTTEAEGPNKSDSANETAKAPAAAEPIVSAAALEPSTVAIAPTPSSETVVTTSAPAAEIEQPVAVAVPAQEPVTIAAAPRWVAEEVPLDAEESMLVLEREMHKAFAAFAAAEYEALPAEERGAVDKSDEPLFATMAPPAIGTPVPV